MILQIVKENQTVHQYLDISVAARTEDKILGNVSKLSDKIKVLKEDYYIQTNFNCDEQYSTFIKALRNRSIKDFNIDVSIEDSIITLSTCANDNNYRVVLHARKIVTPDN